MTVKGVDVSSYQSATFSTSGLDFAIVKATEGTGYINPKMREQAEHARAAGLVVGFYHFLRPGSMRAQAAYFVEQASSIEGDPLFADWEDAGVSCADKDAFLAEVKRLRGSTHRVGLYCNLEYWKNRDTTSNAGDALWIADYVTAGRPRIEAEWLFHQYTDEPVDTNVAAFADRAALRAWAAKGSTPPARPSVDLSQLVAAARQDPDRDGTPVTYAGARVVEDALAAEGLLDRGYVDGHFGSATVTAYAQWQRRLNYSGADADGIPGRASLDALARRHSFNVTS
ncbi:hypothetical protein A8W25_28175 [Streptomyces sp. ERV7]|uniref:GH25 family lysozyme n=1 Tax=Streptomyces sp. ERV7 TaxID=1322334 RepID=UPI0007F50486|nr:GH25 family lysozyme [Streptomyces sp. ERV7]OAR21923.1 hypothetical protein A8W25_28175 [Streptomyces sp. ERV7]